MQKSISCLLIDDDDDDQEIFSMALKDLKDPVHCAFANDGIHALELLNNGSYTPDVIFLDMNMPRMNGIQCLGELRKMNRLKHIPVYIYSTSKDPFSAEAVKLLGAKGYLVKPSDVPALTNMLAEVFALTKRAVN